MEQLTHYNSKFNPNPFPITVLCDSVYFQDNIGSIFRVCDAFGVSKIIFTGKNLIFSQRKINKTSRNTHKHINFEIIQSTQQIIEYITNTNTQTIALEITASSLPIQTFTWSPSQPLILIIGNEITGISQTLLQQCNTHLHINMFGKNSSMNVATALSIALYEITKST